MTLSKPPDDTSPEAPAAPPPDDVERRSLLFAAGGALAGGALAARAFGASTAQAQPPSCDPLAIITVTDAPYSAPTDGVTDATAALQAALDAARPDPACPDRPGGTVVYFPPGRYAVHGPNGLRVPDDVTLLGSGANSRILAASSSPQALLRETSTSAAVRNVRVTNLAFEGNGLANKGPFIGAAIRFHRFENVTVDHCQFLNCGLSAFSGAQDLTTTSIGLDFSHNHVTCTGTNVCTYAVDVRHILGARVTDNAFQRCCRALNVQLYGTSQLASSIVFSGNLCRDGVFNSDGVIMAQVMLDVVYNGAWINNVAIGNNLFDHNSAAAGVGYPGRDIFLEGFSKNVRAISGVTITGNAHRNNEGLGNGDAIIHAKWAEAVAINGNCIQQALNTIACGIHVEDSVGVSVTGNTVVGTNYTHGVCETATIALDNFYLANLSTSAQSFANIATSRSIVLEPTEAGPPPKLDLNVGGYAGYWDTAGMTMP